MFLKLFPILKEGRGDICAKMDQYGHGRGTTQGGFSEYSIVKAKYCYKLKYDITTNEAALLEPMGKHNFFNIILI